MTKKVYRSKIDWWVWMVGLLSLALVLAACSGTYWWLCVFYCVLIANLCVILFCGCWYEIDGDTLVVYQFFRAHRLPIMKIKEVRKTIGYLATAGMSSRRVSIKFTDRSVLKSAMPIEISPKDRDGFIKHLREINPDITVVE